jgi:hypothetical protein
VALDLLDLLLINYTNDRVELGVSFLKEYGQQLLQDSSQVLDSVFSTLKNLRHRPPLTQRTQDIMECLFGVPKDQFKSYPVIQSGLDLVDENDQCT